MKRVLLAAALVCLAFWKPSLGADVLRPLARIGSRLAQRRRLAVLAVGAWSLLLSAVLAGLLGVAPPHIHDEFANLLAADTFLHGRLSNPPHPFWIHFEAVHVLSQPVYMSKYPPAQGLMLALGQLLTGQPVVGSWLSAALACAATCWMLQAWVPARWALLGGVLAAVHPQILKWSQVYWGGSEAWLGGALLLGGFRRVVERPDWKISAWMGVGMAQLAISRPYEGFVLSALVMLSLAVWMSGKRSPPIRTSLSHIVAPLAVLMVLLVAALGIYNVRTTGNTLRMPYMVYEEQYAMAPFMVWQKPRPEPVFRHKLIRDHMIDFALAEFQRQQSLPGFARETAAKLAALAQGYLWDFRPWQLWAAVLLIPLAAFPALLRRDRWLQFAFGLLVLFTLALLLETWMWPRYAAPAACLVMLLVVQALRHLAVWRFRHKPVGPFITRALVALCLFSVLPWAYVRAKELALNDWDQQRVKMIRQLAGEPEKHLVIVRYGPRQSVHDDWVHNEADIDASKVAWARDMGDAANRKLADYFKGRKIWLLDAEFAPDREEAGKIPQATLVPYLTQP